MVSFERESRWIRVNGILPKSLGESDSRPTSDPGLGLPPDLVFGNPMRASSPARNGSVSTGTANSCKPKNSKSKPKTRLLKTLNVNSQSVRAKNAGFRCLVQEEDPDIIVGTESWLNSNITPGEDFPSHYNIFRKDRVKKNDSHSGVFYSGQKQSYCSR